ncbi:MAG: hypothetical protein ISS50_00095 [Anaerolineae bacterium]|nr:hypothetical protein [Anaerolineae bacterium]
MDTVDDKQRQFEERLDAIVQRRRREAPRPISDTLSTGFEARLRDYEARLDAQIAAHRRETQAAVEAIWGIGPTPVPRLTPEPPSLLPGQQRIVLHGEPVLQELDRLFAEEFDLARYFPAHSLADYPTIYAETLEEFFQPYLETADVSQSGKEALMARLKAQAEETLANSRGGVYSVHFPGRGCYLNGWLFARSSTATREGTQPKSARDALADPAILPTIVATAVHEKLGHGFVSEFTALGEEKKNLGLWRCDIAQRFGLRAADTPEGALLAEKEAVIYQSSRLLEEGWATWIEHHTMGRWAALDGRDWPLARYTLTQVWDTLARLMNETQDSAVKEAVQSIQQALEVVFLVQDATLEDIHSAVLAFHFHSSVADDAFARAFGQPFEYVIGYLLLRKMEAGLGALCLPYAVAIAANVTYGLDQVSASDLQRLVARAPRVSVDSRLAHLGMLELEQKGNVGELARRAHEELNLAIPSSLRVSVDPQLL